MNAEAREREIMDERVKAIRENELVGKGSCSIVDECMSDDEIIVELDQWEITDPQEAVNHYIDMEGLQVDAGLNARSGEDDDTGLTIASNWNARKTAYKDGLTDSDRRNAPASVTAAHVGIVHGEIK